MITTGDMGVVSVDITQEHRKRRRKEDDKPNLTMAAVIAIDPGETTGWSLIVVNPECLSDPKEKILANILVHQHGEVSSKRTGPVGIFNEGECLAVNDLYTLAESWPHAAIVIEDFIIRNNDRTRSFLSPVRMTSKLEQLLWADSRIYFRQQANDAKTTAKDWRLKEWGMYEREGGLGHARDADRHAIVFLRRLTQSAKLRAQAFPHLYDQGAPFA